MTTIYYGDCTICGVTPCRCNPQQAIYVWPQNDLSWWKVQYLACEHCYCKPAEQHQGVGAHKQCCKCGTVMAAKFLHK